MDIILNQIAIWKPCGATELNSKISPKGQLYKEANSPAYIEAQEGLVRHTKDYKVKRVEFCLFVRTKPDVSVSWVESELDRVAKTLSKEYILQSTANADIRTFEYTPHFIGKEESNGS